MGVRGQKCLISGNHMVRTWRRELGLAREKHKTTTSDLEGEKQCSVQDWWEIQQGEGWQGQSRAVSHVEKVPAERQHAAVDGAERTEKKTQKRSVLSHWTPCQMMLNHAWYVCGRSLFNKAFWEKAGVTRHADVSLRLDLWASDLCGPSLLRKSP